jgi:hypothetical protein
MHSHFLTNKLGQKFTSYKEHCATVLQTKICSYSEQILFVLQTKYAYVVLFFVLRTNFVRNTNKLCLQYGCTVFFVTHEIFAQFVCN